MRIDSGYTTKEGIKLYYEVYETGYYIYFGENAQSPSIHQYEPYIPNPDISYEDNALQMCMEIEESSKVSMQESPTVTGNTYVELRADVDYLLLLTE